MVACAHCGLHVPESEGVRAAGGFFCSEEHPPPRPERGDIAREREPPRDSLADDFSRAEPLRYLNLPSGAGRAVPGGRAGAQSRGDSPTIFRRRPLPTSAVLSLGFPRCGPAGVG